MATDSHGKVRTPPHGAAQRTDRPDHPDFFESFICGAASGVLSKTFDYPLDSIKTRVQLLPQNSPNAGVLACARRICQNEGFRGFYAGLPAPLASCTLCSAIGFTAFNIGGSAYDSTTRALPTARPSGVQIDTTTLTSSDVAVAAFDPWRAIFAGGFAGVPKSTVMTPFDLVKCRMQAQPLRWTSVVHCSRDSVRQAGLRGLYRGHSAMLCREVVGNACWFGYYEAAMHAFTPAGGRRSDVGLFAACVAAGTSGIVFWTATMPFDVAKTRVQVDGHAYGARCAPVAVARILRHEGARALYAGYSPTCLRTVPASILLFQSYDCFVERYQRRLGHRPRPPATEGAEQASPGRLAAERGHASALSNHHADSSSALGGGWAAAAAVSVAASHMASCGMSALWQLGVASQPRALIMSRSNGKGSRLNS